MADTKQVSAPHSTHQIPFQPIPAFYRDEMSAATNKMITSWVVTSALLILFITLTSLVSSAGMKALGTGRFWLIPFFLIPALVSFFRSLSSTFEQKKLIAHQHDQFNEPNMIIIRDYRRLQVGTINTHWFSGLTYVWCLFIFFILLIAATCFSAYRSAGGLDWSTFWNSIKDWKWETGDGTQFTNPFLWLTTPTGDGSFFFIAFISLMIALFGTIVHHCASVVSINKRIENIDDFYGKEVISPEEIRAIKKSANIRDGIIFFVCSIILIGMAFGFYAKIKSTTGLSSSKK